MHQHESLYKPLSFALDVEGPGLACDPMACCSVAAAESSCMAIGLIFAGATSFPAFKHSNTGTRLAGKLARNSKGNNTRRSIVDDGWLRYVYTAGSCLQTQAGLNPNPNDPPRKGYVATLDFNTHTPKTLQKLQNASLTPTDDLTHMFYLGRDMSQHWTRVLKLETLETIADFLVNFSCSVLGALLQMPRIMPPSF